MAAVLVGVAFAVLAAVGLSVQSLAVRLGTRTRSVSEVVAAIFAVNLLVLVPTAAVVAYPQYRVTTASLLAFAAAGVLGSLFARVAYFVGIARLGASRTEPLKALFPLVAVGTGVLLLPLHHPVEVAEQMATLDAFAEGVVVGVGSGYRDIEFDAFGIDKRERIGRMVEGIEIMNRLWTETDVTYEGNYYSLDEATITPRPEEKPTVWIGANHPRAVERAARIGDAWFANPQETVEELKGSAESED
jgi:hypothetical protein